MDSDIHSETVSASGYASSDIPSTAIVRQELEIDYAPPKTVAGTVGLLMGIGASTALMLPSLCGAVLGWWASGEFSLNGTVLMVLSYLCLTIGLTIFSEYSDFRFGLRPESKYFNDSSLLGKNLISAGVFTPGFVLSTGALFLLASLLCILILALTITGWPSLFFYAIMALCLALYLIPLPWHGYLSWGLGEIGILASFGIVAAVSGFYIQQAMVDVEALFFGIPLGFFAVLILFSRSLIRQRRDWMIRKRTFAVALGDQRANYYFIFLIVAAYASLLLVVTLTSLPLILLLALSTLPMAIGPFKQVEGILQTPIERYQLHQLMINVMLLTGVLMSAALVLYKLF